MAKPAKHGYASMYPSLADVAQSQRRIEQTTDWRALRNAT